MSSIEVRIGFVELSRENCDNFLLILRSDEICNTVIRNLTINARRSQMLPAEC